MSISIKKKPLQGLILITPCKKIHDFRRVGYDDSPLLLRAENTL